MITARVTKFGDATVVVLSKEMLAQLGVRAGDEVNVGPAIDELIQAFDGERKLDRQREIDQQVEVAERIMEKRRDVLRRLAE